MRRFAVRFVSLAALSVALTSAAVAPLAAQTAPVTPPSPQFPSGLDQQRAVDTRNELRDMLGRYPPALGRVLKLDPTLMTNDAYLAPYPALGAFLQRHPEVPRYPAYFLEFVSIGDSWESADPDVRVRREALQMWRGMTQSLTIFGVFLTGFLTVGWLIRSFVAHRRWLRAMKVQSDVHGRLMERFHSNEELMAYVQSPAGRRFLEGMPVAAEPASVPGPAAPFGRILWAAQAGLVLACAGTGLLVVRPHLLEEIGDVLLVFGVLGLALGVGFVLSAGASYILSSRLGLIDAARPGGANRP